MLRYAGAGAIVGVGAVHAQQYYGAFFSVVPVIGTLFLLSFIGAGFVAATLVAPVRRLGAGIGDLVLVLAALGGIGIAFGSLVSLLVSEYTPLFGFIRSLVRRPPNQARDDVRVLDPRGRRRGGSHVRAVALAVGPRLRRLRGV